MPSRAPAPPPLAERQRPGLSESLTLKRRPDRCQSCGGAEDLRTWNEHDAWDQPQRPAVLIVLCEICSARLIEAHPRLYTRVDRLAPAPGAMAVCVDCRHREGLACRSPQLKANGGMGLRLSFPKPDVMHLNYGGGRGEWRNFYKAPPTCAGHEDRSA